MKRRSFIASIVAGLTVPLLSKVNAEPEVLANTVEEVELDYEPLSNPSGCFSKAEIVQKCKNTRRVPLAYAMNHEGEISLSYDMCDWYRCGKEDYWYERGREVFNV